MTISDPVYADAVPLGGVVDPATHQVDADGEYVFQAGRTPSEPDSVVRTFFGGGGGWGDPLERDPELVRRDVRDEYVTIEGAARDYGVVVRGDLRHPEALTVDVDATAVVRTELRTSRAD
jgi:N-methylhydantoinase B